jgi:hypothetical protein
VFPAMSKIQPYYLSNNCDLTYKFTLLPSVQSVPYNKVIRSSFICCFRYYGNKVFAAYGLVLTKVIQLSMPLHDICQNSES